MWNNDKSEPQPGNFPEGLEAPAMTCMDIKDLTASEEFVKEVLEVSVAREDRFRSKLFGILVLQPIFSLFPRL